MDDSIKKLGQAGTENAGEIGDEALVREVAQMLSEWEDGDELPTEFARRLIARLQETRR